MGGVRDRASAMCSLRRRRNGSISGCKRNTADNRVNRCADLRWTSGLQRCPVLWSRSAKTAYFFACLNGARSSLSLGVLRMEARNFPSPWSAEEWATCYVVNDAKGRPLVHVYFADEPARRIAAKLLSRHEARQLAESIARLPKLLFMANSPQSEERRHVTSFPQ